LCPIQTLIAVNIFNIREPIGVNRKSQCVNHVPIGFVQVAAVVVNPDSALPARGGFAAAQKGHK